MWVVLLAFLFSPGPARSVFSGIPLSLPATILAVMLIGVAVATRVIRPRRSPRAAWAVIILLAAITKIALAPLLVPSGWDGRYFTGQHLAGGDVEPLQPVRFTSAAGPSTHRLDRALQYDKTSFGLDFINDMPRSVDFRPFVRDEVQPIRVLWRGWTANASPKTVVADVTASGLLILRVDGRELWRGKDPKQAKVTLAIPAGTRRLDLLYDKPPGVSPSIHIDGLPAVTATAANDAAIRNSELASIAIHVLGALALLAFAAALVDAYRPLRATWTRTDVGRLAVLAFTAAFLLLGLARAIRAEHTTVQLTIGDDYLRYEAMARAILRGDVLLTEGHAPGEGTPYYHYPLYPFALAAAHYLFGDDFANVLLFNCICVAMLGPLIFAFLGRHLPPPATAAAMTVALFFGGFYLFPYTATAYSDNLYLVTMFGTLLGGIAALEAPRTWRFFACGVLIALAAATRPSGFIFLPFFAAAILLYKEIGGLAARVKAIAATVGGFAAGVSPFTIRNRIVTGRWVMLVGGYMSITAFLYPPERDQYTIPLLVDGHMPTMLQTLGQIRSAIAENPASVAWVEMRKVLFTLGWTDFGPAGLHVPFFGVYPILFLIALFAKRIPRSTAYVLLAFLASHLVSMVLGAPWTYGYKSILPFHLACLIGAAFLLKPLGARAVGDRAIDHE